MKYYFRNIVFYLAICLFFVADVLAQTNIPDGYTVFHHPNGKVSSEGMMRNGKPDGYWKSYYVTGVMSSEGNRVNFLRDSTWVFYTQTGDTAQIINYRLDKKSGYHYQYETVTQRNNVSKNYIKSKEMYLDDKREGPSYYYHPNGKIQQVINYRNGKRQGFSRVFDENGTIITIEEYINGQLTSREYINRVNANGQKHGVWRTFHPNGTLKEEEFYKNGVLDGITRIYSDKSSTPIYERSYRDGKIIEEGPPLIAEPMDKTSFYEDGVTIKRKGTYLDSIPIAHHYFYSRDGKPEKAIRYDMGARVAEGPVNENLIRVGEWKTFYVTGELRAFGKYSNNAPVGEWTYFFQNGQKEKVGRLNNGVEDGEWTFYFQNGQKQIGNLNNGIQEGEWKWFYPSGEIFLENFFVNGKKHGLSVQYSDSATIVAKGEYVNGEREGFWIENVGYVREEGNYIMGLKHGMWKTYQRDGQLYHSGEFVQGNPNGRHVFYYPDGTLKEEQFYVMGRRDKTWKKYYENGGLFLTITYKNDVEIKINGIRIDDNKK